MAAAETISCHCNECDILICLSFNDWIEISNSYSTYERPGAFTDPGLEQVEQIRDGSKNSELEGCSVKPLRCYNCKTPLGVRCVKAPVEKRTNINRSYLKLAKMTMKSITSGNLVDAKIKKRQHNVLKVTSTDPLVPSPKLFGPTSPKKPSAPQKSGRGVEHNQAPFSDQVPDLTMGPIIDTMPILEEQRRDIDRIMASVHILQQDMICLRDFVESLGGRSQASPDFAGNVDILTNSVTKANSRLSALDALKVEMKMMQQRIKRMEDSNSTGQRSSTVLGSAQVSRRPSPTIDEPATPRNDDQPFSAPRTPASAYFDGLFTPQKTASEKRDLMDGGDRSFQGLPLEYKAEAWPPQKPFTTRPRTPTNGIASRESHTPIEMPPPQVPRKAPEQKSVRCNGSTVSNVATPRTVSTSLPSSTDATTVSSVIPQTPEASTNSHHNRQESHIYDDELVDDVRPQSSTGSTFRLPRHSPRKTTHPCQTQTKESPKQPPAKTQRRQSAPMPPPSPKPSNENTRARGRPAHHDSKRRKTTAFDANTPNTSLRASDPREARLSSSRRDAQGFVVRLDGKVDGRSAMLQKPENKGKERPGVRDEEGYLLRPDGTRNLKSVRSLDQWRRRSSRDQ